MKDLKTVTTRRTVDPQGGQALAARGEDDFGAFQVLLDSWNGEHRNSSAEMLPAPLHQTSSDPLDKPCVDESASRQVLELISGESRRLADEIAATRGRLNVLESDLARARQREREAAVSVLRDLLARYDLRPSEILESHHLALCQQTTISSQPSRDSGSPLESEASVSETVGKSWCGRGRRPKWLKQMLAEGRQLSDFSARPGALAATSSKE